MQVKNEHNIEKRNDIYASKTIARHFQRGGKYQDSKQVIMSNLLDFNLFGFQEYISKTVTVLDKHRDFEVSSILEAYYIELPKFRKTTHNMEQKMTQWLVVIDGENKGEIEMAEKKNKILKDAKVELEYLTGEEEVRRLAELRDKWESDWNSYMDWTRNEGKIEGKTEGKVEEKKEIAKIMLKKNMSIELISEITGLTKEEIETLK